MALIAAIDALSEFWQKSTAASSSVAQPRDHRLKATVRFGPAAGLGADALRHEGELTDRERAEHERIQIMQPHAAVDRIDGEGQRQPRFDKAIQIGYTGIEVNLGNDASGRLQLDDEAEGIGGL